MYPLDKQDILVGNLQQYIVPTVLKHWFLLYLKSYAFDMPRLRNVLYADLYLAHEFHGRIEVEHLPCKRTVAASTPARGIYVGIHNS